MSNYSTPSPITPPTVYRPSDDPTGAGAILPDVSQPKIRTGRSFARELIETVLLIAAIYAFVNLATARFVVDGHSMLPNFDTDQFIIVSRLSYLAGEPQRGDVIVFHYPMQPDRDFIKRVIGLPGETVTILGGRVYINEQLLDEPYIERFCIRSSCDGEWAVGEDEFFVLGDNRSASKDSQDFGPVHRQFIVGRAFVRYWPPEDWAMIEHWSYNEQNGAPLPTMTPVPTSTPSPTPTPLPLPSGPIDLSIPPSPTFTPYPNYYGGY